MKIYLTEVEAKFLFSVLHGFETSNPDEKKMAVEIMEKLA